MSHFANFFILYLSDLPLLPWSKTNNIKTSRKQTALGVALELCKTNKMI